MVGMKLFSTGVALLSTFMSTTLAVDADLKSNVAVYYGQGANQLRLSHFCQETSLDIINLGFINVFPEEVGDWPGSNFGNQCDGTYYADSLLLAGCHQIWEDIPVCKAMGKTILLSLGGSSADPGVMSHEVAEWFADFLWYSFGPYNASAVEQGFPRPFQNNSVDGFDFDIESDGGHGYGSMIDRLRDHYTNYPEHQFYISGAPQCPIPDLQLSYAIQNSHFDFIWVQFYNTFACSARAFVEGLTTFNFASWVDVIQASANPDAKLYIGLPAGEAAANAGYYLDETEVWPLISEYIQSYPDTFGGIMLWEATASENNLDARGLTYAEQMKEILYHFAPPPPRPTPTPTPTLTITRTVVPIPAHTSSSVPSSSSVVSVSSLPTVEHSSTSASPSANPHSSSAIVSGSATASASTHTTTPSSSVAQSSSVTPSGSATRSGIVVPSGSAASHSLLTPSGSVHSSSSVTPSGSLSSSSSIHHSSSVTPSGSATTSGYPVSSGSATRSGHPSSFIKPSSSNVATGSLSVPLVPTGKPTVSASQPHSSSVQSSSSVTPVSPSTLPTSSTSQGVTESSTRTLTRTRTPVPSRTPITRTTKSKSTDVPSSSLNSSTPVASPSSSNVATTSSDVSTATSSGANWGSTLTSGESTFSTGATGSSSSSTETGSVQPSGDEGASQTATITASPSITSAPTSSSAETITTVIVTSYTDICPTGFTTIWTTITTYVCPEATATASVTNPPSGASPTTATVPEGWTTTVTVCTQCAATPTTVTLTLPITTPSAEATTVAQSTETETWTTTVSFCESCGPTGSSVTLTVPYTAPASWETGTSTGPSGVSPGQGEGSGPGASKTPVHWSSSVIPGRPTSTALIPGVGAIKTSTHAPSFVFHPSTTSTIGGASGTATSTPGSTAPAYNAAGSRSDMINFFSVAFAVVLSALLM
ncbi:hypothetical protein N7493_010338 [Penicillium malachiteum]|uniref:chitinase n=1 Tax=Penicillium malachiteum TaxID=1324776 RepID=A0AAD6HCZ1_9EURO|nr:hypothetical protein N7493_010338 [Penicillium malachiteum]